MGRKAPSPLSLWSKTPGWLWIRVETVETREAVASGIASVALENLPEGATMQDVRRVVSEATEKHYRKLREYSLPAPQVSEQEVANQVLDRYWNGGD